MKLFGNSLTVFIYQIASPFARNLKGKEVQLMSKIVHHGGKVGKAGSQLASNSTGKSTKSKAGKVLADHKHRKH